MNSSPEALYLSLMKKTLSFTLWNDPGVPLLYYHMPLPTRILARAMTKVFGFFGLQLVLQSTIDNNAEGEVWPMYAHTMIGLKRLDNLQSCVESVIKDGVEGDLIETGVWRGGACIFMRALLAAYGMKDRRVFVADSFAGLPEPDITRFPVTAQPRSKSDEFAGNLTSRGRDG